MNDKERIQKKAYHIGIELIKFSKSFKNIALFCTAKKDDVIKDRFLALCNLHITMPIGETYVINDNTFFADETKLESLYNKYDKILIIDGVRFADDYNIIFETINDKVSKLTYYTKDVFTSENLYIILPNYDYGIYDYKSFKENDSTKIIRTIKKEYEYLLK